MIYVFNSENSTRFSCCSNVVICCIQWHETFNICTRDVWVFYTELYMPKSKQKKKKIRIYPPSYTPAVKRRRRWEKKSYKIVSFINLQSARIDKRLLKTHLSFTCHKHYYKIHFVRRVENKYENWVKFLYCLLYNFTYIYLN